MTILAAGMDMDEKDDEHDGLRLVEDQDYDADFVCIKGEYGWITHIQSVSIRDTAMISRY